MSEFSQSRTEKIPVRLNNGTVIKVEVDSTVDSATGRQEVGNSLSALPVQEMTDAIEGIVDALKAPLEKVKPDKASVKFGMELAVESGTLTAVIVKGSGKANIEITLEWSK